VSTIETHEGYAPFGEWQTWFKVTGDLKADRLPLVVAHGGPGCTHSYVDSFRDLAALDGRAVIHYDQLGCGLSTRLRDKGVNFWTVQLFLDELDNLLNHLGIADRYAYLGQSWGGMLGAEHAVRRPAGLKALVIANSPASMKTWVSEAIRLRKELGGNVHETLARHEATGSFDHPEYVAATDVFNKVHVCRTTPWPVEVVRTFEAMAEDPTVYGTMNGPNEFHVIGTLSTWTVEERLSGVTAPTLVISGQYDEATPECVRPFVENIPDSRWKIFEQSSHMPHWEEREACMQTVSSFLRLYDSADAEYATP